jgi:hypothetical protein
MLKHTKLPIAAIALATLSLIAFAADKTDPKPATSQDPKHDCVQRVQQAVDNLKHEVDRHGAQSRQAEKRRKELRKILDVCGPAPQDPNGKKDDDD